MVNSIIADTKQKQRIERFFMSALFFVLCIIPVGLSVHLNLLPARVLVIWLAVCISGNTIIYLLLRFNINQRFRDPSMTIPHMLFAIGLVMYLQIYAGPTRGGYLLALMLTFAFGCFKLKTRQLMWLSLITVIAYLCTIPIIMQVEGPRFNPAVELVTWTAFAVFLPALAILTNSFNALRKQLTEANIKLTELNNIDGLTNVKNRSCFNQQIDYEWRRSQRTNSPLSLLMIDIDYFKSINDSHGHLGGDACLKNVAIIIKDSAKRITDEVFRYGGEEFAVILASTDATASSHVANCILKQVEETSIPFCGKNISVTVSIGSATVVPGTDRGSNHEILISQADKALYKAKNNGRNRVCEFIPIMLKNEY